MPLLNVDLNIDGNILEGSRELFDMELFASFDTDPEGETISEGEPQPSITASEITFLNEAAIFVKNHVEKGKQGGLGIFEALPFGISINDENNNLLAFDGFLDLMTYQELSPVEVKCNIQKLDGLDSFSDRIQGTTVSFLEEQGVYTNKDYVNVFYVVEKEVDFLEIMILTLSLYMMIKELVEGIQRTVQRITDLVKAFTPDITLSGGVPNAGAIISAIVLIIIEIIYQILISIAITELLKQILENILSPVRGHKGITLRTLLEKATNHLGYGFVSPIPELDQFVYLPSRPKKDKPLLKGLPNARDFGYKISESYQLALKMFHAKVAIIDGDVHLRPRKDTFWIKNSTFKMKNTLTQSEIRQYNTGDLNASVLIQFLTDLSDKWTIDDFPGTVYEVITKPISTKNEKLVLIKGLKEINIPVALGTRKDGLNDLELVVRDLASFIDGLINAFGGKSSLAKQINQRVGMLKVSDQIHNVPKILAMNSKGSILKNHKDILSAKALWNKYMNYLSFIEDNHSRQKRIFKNESIPFGFSNFLETIKNSYFVTESEGEGKFRSIAWRVLSDRATADFEIEEIYTTNLTEIKIEPL